LVEAELALQHLGVVGEEVGVVGHLLGARGDGEDAIGAHRRLELRDAPLAVLGLSLGVFGRPREQLVAQGRDAAPLEDVEVGVVEDDLVERDAGEGRTVEGGGAVERVAAQVGAVQLRAFGRWRRSDSRRRGWHRSGSRT
jgi:hypothetical protein